MQFPACLRRERWSLRSNHDDEHELERPPLRTSSNGWPAHPRRVEVRRRESRGSVSSRAGTETMSVQRAIAVGLARRRPAWRGAVAFFALPLAPYWAFREQMPLRAFLWFAAACPDVVTRGLFRG
jgi:hypothetical protein